MGLEGQEGRVVWNKTGEVGLMRKETVYFRAMGILWNFSFFNWKTIFIIENFENVEK